MSVKIRPLQDRIVVKRLEEEEKSKGGIYIPDSAKEKPSTAVVLAVGPGKIENGQRIEPEVKVNDKILIGKYSGTELKLDGEELVVLREDDIMGVLL